MENIYAYLCRRVNTNSARKGPQLLFPKSGRLSKMLNTRSDLPETHVLALPRCLPVYGKAFEGAMIAIKARGLC